MELFTSERTVLQSVMLQKKIILYDHLQALPINSRYQKMDAHVEFNIDFT